GAILLVDPRVRGPSCPRSRRRRFRPSTASRLLPCALLPPPVALLPFALRPPSPAACLPWRRSTGGLRAVLQHILAEAQAVAARRRGGISGWDGCLATMAMVVVVVVIVFKGKNDGKPLQSL
ncbi:MAG: hypothetical protein BJ554DRAFT_2046, partial [Olpidium bornovanus]